MPWFFGFFFVFLAFFLVTRLLFGWRAWGYGACYGYAPGYAYPMAAALSPEEALRQRLAKGEIDVAEYERQRATLGKG